MKEARVDQYMSYECAEICLLMLLIEIVNTPENYAINREKHNLNMQKNKLLVSGFNMLNKLPQAMGYSSNIVYISFSLYNLVAKEILNAMNKT